MEDLRRRARRGPGGPGGPPDGYVYRHAWAQRLQLSWGRVQEDRLYVDTQRVAEFDAHLAPAANGG